MMPPPDYHKNTVGMDDLRRLGSKGGSRQVSSQGHAPTFGPTSMFSGPRGSKGEEGEGRKGSCISNQHFQVSFSSIDMVVGAY